MKKESFANLILTLLISGAFIFAIVNLGSVLTPKGLFAGIAPPSDEVAGLLEQVSLQHYTMGEGAGHQVNAEFVIHNGTAQQVKNLEVLCEFYNPAGRFLDQQKWLLPGIVDPGSTLQFTAREKRFIHSGTAMLECAAIDLQPVNAPVFALHRKEAGHRPDAHGEGDAHHGQDAQNHDSH